MRAVEAALLIPDGKRVDAAFALQCVDAAIDAERDADAAERAAITALMQRAPPPAAPMRARWCSASRSPARWKRPPTARPCGDVAARSHPAGAFGMSASAFEPVFIGAGGALRTDPRRAMSARRPPSWRGIAALGLPIPPAFVLPTSLCAGVVAGDAAALKAMRKGLAPASTGSRQTTARRLGDARAPLFVSVRSGAERSMPGMLDTILNVGMNATSVHGLIRLTGNPRMAFDS